LAIGSDFREDDYQEFTALRVIFENVAAFGLVNADFSVTSRAVRSETSAVLFLVGEFVEKRKIKEHSTSFFMVSLSERPQIDQKEGIPICCDASSY